MSHSRARHVNVRVRCVTACTKAYQPHSLQYIQPCSIHIHTLYVCVCVYECVLALGSHLKLCGCYLFHLLLSLHMVIQSRQTYNWLSLGWRPLPSHPHRPAKGSALMSGRSVEREDGSTRGPGDLLLTQTDAHPRKRCSPCQREG